MLSWDLMSLLRLIESMLVIVIMVKIYIETRHLRFMSQFEKTND